MGDMSVTQARWPAGRADLMHGLLLNRHGCHARVRAAFTLAVGQQCMGGGYQRSVPVSCGCLLVLYDVWFTKIDAE